MNLRVLLKTKAKQEIGLHVFVVGLLGNLVLSGWFLRPRGHALCISEDRHPPHSSCVCVCVRTLPYTAHSLCSLTPMAI